MRNAEADRKASCPFADRVGALSIGAFEAICPTDLRSSYKQTVISTFLVEDRLADTLHVVALGVGTKTLPADVLLADPSTTQERICDCHAECLAHKALKRFLMIEARRTLRREEPTSSSSSSIFMLCEDGSDLQLRDGIHFHMYSSSQPCGNASIKKWAKGGKLNLYNDLDPVDRCPDSKPHNQFFVTARKDGQVAPLCKRDGLSQSLKGSEITNEGAVPSGMTSPSSGEGYIMSCSDKIAKWNALGIQGSLLASLLGKGVYLTSIVIGRKFSQLHSERALCCRLQGFHYPVVLTSAFSPNNYCQIALASTTILAARCKEKEVSEEDGRPNESIILKSAHKKGRVCLCKTTSGDCTSRVIFEPSSVEPRYSTHHPIMMCTSVKFDKSSIATSDSMSIKVDKEPVIIGACFDEPRSMVWWYGTDEVEVIDSRTGLLSSSNTSAEEPIRSSGVCKRRLLTLFEEVIESADSNTIERLLDFYNEAKERLFNEPTSIFHENWVSPGTLVLL